MRLEKVNKIMTWLVRIFILITAIWTIWQKDYGNTGILVITMILTFYDLFLTKTIKFKLDPKLKIALILFIFSAQVLGSVLDFYGKFLWWDTMLHTISGVIFFFIGVALIEQVNQKTNRANIHKVIALLFGVFFALATGVIWEIIEFLIDTYLNGNMQVTKGMIGQEAVKDTMIDLISVTVGSTVIAIEEGIKLKNKAQKKK